MLSEKISTLFDTLDVSSTDVARSIGCSPSNFSRVRRGTRVPKPTSPTMKKLISAIFGIVQDDEKRSVLCHLCGATENCSDDLLKDRLLLWLYDDIVLPQKILAKRKSSIEQETAFAAFGERFNAVLDLIDISNGELSDKTGIDVSYVSRLRRGERMPRYHSKYLASICYTLIDEAKQKDLLPFLSQHTQIPEAVLEDTDGIKVLQQWLLMFSSKNEELAVDHLLSVLISDIPERPPIASKAADFVEPASAPGNSALSEEDYSIQMTLPAPALEEPETRGTEGLCRLVTRFLSEAIQNKETDLLLYSDQGTDWMGGDYAKSLVGLLTKCIQNGVRITILHNIDRPIPELFEAIGFWMPLYLSGQVRSFYSDRTAGERFSHTFFIRPGQACIEGFCSRTEEARCHYRYHKDKATIADYKAMLDGILKEARPLVAIDTDPSLATGDIPFENTFVSVDAKQVVVKRTEDPKLSFTFTHPLMCHAFYRYFQNIEG
ncbi:MAG: helix-turn-helix transcriptional regulator [Lachnospiraceae bacterium]|nr:helix-turn-helix transcriptional regulator [Lachnospiraceae bacterium]